MQDEKSLYGLKQSPRMWYQKIDTYMLGTWLHKKQRGSLCVF
jgi:hypothetical protein